MSRIWVAIEQKTELKLLSNINLNFVKIVAILAIRSVHGTGTIEDYCEVCLIYRLDER